MYCLCLSDQTLSLCHVSTVMSHFYSYSVLNMFDTARPMRISFSKHETETSCSGFMGKKSLIAFPKFEYEIVWEPYGRNIFKFSLGFISECTIDLCSQLFTGPASNGGRTESPEISNCWLLVADAIFVLLIF